MANKINKLDAHKAYKVLLLDGKYQIVDFYRHEIGAFAYGNGTMTTVEINEQYFASIDTRYDWLVMNDFGEWCEKYLKNLYVDGVFWDEIK